MSSSPNTAFIYLYRDADNYKKWGKVVFSGSCRDRYEQQLREVCQRGELFVACQIRIPEVFLWREEQWEKTVADHDWHEFYQLRATGDEPDDVHDRSIEAFVEEFRGLGRDGWEIN